MSITYDLIEPSPLQSETIFGLENIYHLRITHSREIQSQILEWVKANSQTYLAVRHKMGDPFEHVHFMFKTQTILSTIRQRFSQEISNWINFKSSVYVKTK